ncbi:hypothetical protein DL768_000764 [Monosporascus sp. mg162]|nr:hypothetical protein DL768_000764 [Monosporascus sp. mg162]
MGLTRRAPTQRSVGLSPAIFKDVSHRVNGMNYPSGDDRRTQQKFQGNKNRSSGIKSMTLPYENYIGAVLNRKYRIALLCTNKDHLDIYSVTSWDGVSFKAQAFKLSRHPDKLYSSRKRRVKRLKQSGNCTDDFEQGHSRYLISPGPPAQKPRGQGAKQPAKPKQGDSSEHQFPGLGPSATRGPGSESGAEKGEKKGGKEPRILMGSALLGAELFARYYSRSPLAAPS